MVAVIDGAVKDNLSAIICCILLCSFVFNCPGVFATIVSSHALPFPEGSSHEPIRAIRSKLTMDPAEIPPP